MDYQSGEGDIHNCLIKQARAIKTNHAGLQRVKPQRRRGKVYVGCGAGFAGDRPLAALKLLQRVKEMNYLVLECLAERTLSDLYQGMLSGCVGYDSRISEWMDLLLPLAVEKGTCIVTNMGAMDPLGAQEKVLDVASNLGLSIIVSVAHEVIVTKTGTWASTETSSMMQGGISTYLGAAPIVECLEKYKPNVIITSRVADAALFLGPMVYELGWDWNDFKLLAQGSLAGHLLECGCQLTGGYFMHAGDKHRDIPFEELRNLSLPYAEVRCDGEVIVAKADGSGGNLNFSTCAQQLLYEVTNPAAYITPDVVINLGDVLFQSLSSSKVLCTGATPSSELVPVQLLRLVPKDCGWKGWGEISYGGYECVKRAIAAEFLVRSWMEEVAPGVDDRISAYIIGYDSLKASSSLNAVICDDIRLRMDGLFEKKEHAISFTREFTSLYTNGPAGGGGISTGHKKEIALMREMVNREDVFWRTGSKRSNVNLPSDGGADLREDSPATHFCGRPVWMPTGQEPEDIFSSGRSSSPVREASPAPSGQKIPLYRVAHSRSGDKGNDLNFSLIPHFPPDVKRLRVIVTPEWVRGVVSKLLATSPFPDSNAVAKREEWANEHVGVEIYSVEGIQSLNVVVRNILDGGVNCSRRIDRHGKTISDLILCQQVVLPP